MTTLKTYLELQTAIFGAEEIDLDNLPTRTVQVRGSAGKPLVDKTVKMDKSKYLRKQRKELLRNHMAGLGDALVAVVVAKGYPDADYVISKGSIKILLEGRPAAEVL